MSDQKIRNKEYTRQKIIDVAIKLIAEQGYKTTTLLQISNEAGVSEMTVIRHFQTKENILIESIKTLNSYLPQIKQFIKTEAVYELEHDIKKIITLIQESILKNRQIMTIVLNEKEFEHKIDKEMPLDIIKVLADYFKLMKEKKKMRQLDTEAVAFDILSFLSGTASLSSRFGDKLTSTTEKESIDTFVQILSKGLKP
ncbi:TetR/AcrR family transcriptional regulator [Bacillus sp. SCS-151]|uniref:TetR/AcrR family transcriptional regulator n=1 Tax=Nanhaiella sioensis TaxID=3115293 RepID=UPI00397BA30F